MNVDGVAYHSIWVNADGWSVDIIDQNRLPHAFVIQNLATLQQACDAIRNMQVRGAPLIGATAAYGFYLAMRDDPSNAGMEHAYQRLYATRPTAVNLRWALDRLKIALLPLEPAERAAGAFDEAAQVVVLDIEINHAIGTHGLELIRQIAARAPGETVNILTHCNAGWLATVDWGTATAPIYLAHEAGIKIHVWVDETRPRNQGASLTAWELGQHGVPHSLIVDNVGGHLMQHGLVDLCLVGSDRTTRSGDVCNKVGTYLKALAANDNDVPFYVCLPSTTIDWNIDDGIAEIPIEQRDGREVSEINGKLENGEISKVSIAPDETPVANYAFDVTPARLVTGLITERGVFKASEASLTQAFPDNGLQGPI
ncbi:MAG: S-methyl-5-thioribose-1-phosphate isomerase [Gammaproteobacteria bacterium]|nr:S-methyl-5-thioribose-1-phosphate isomerase [Gammaproteobacteria bacterium]